MRGQDESLPLWERMRLADVAFGLAVWPKVLFR